MTEAYVGKDQAAIWLGGSWPPSADHRNRVDRRTGRMYRTADYKDFLELMAKIVKGLSLPRFGTEWLVCELHFVRPDRRRRDAHNTIKVLLDGLQAAGMFEDDLRVMPRIMSVRDMADVRAHPLIPHGQSEGVGCAAEPGLLVLLYQASEETMPAADAR